MPAHVTLHSLANVCNSFDMTRDVNVKHISINIYVCVCFVHDAMGTTFPTFPLLVHLTCRAAPIDM